MPHVPAGQAGDKTAQVQSELVDWEKITFEGESGSWRFVFVSSPIPNSDWFIEGRDFDEESISVAEVDVVKPNKA